MKFDLVVERGPCNTQLRGWSIGIAVANLVLYGISVLASPTTLNFVGLAIAIITNVCLLFGSLRQNYFLVGFWLIFPLLITIGYPFAILGSIFNFGGYRQSTGSNSIIYAIFIYTLMLVIFLFCARLVYSYFKQLKKRHSNPEHSVVV